MNFGTLVQTAIAQVVPPMATEQIVNVSEEFVKAMINKVYHIIERSALWKYSEAEADVTAVAATRTVSMPADYGTPLMVLNNVSGAPLTYHDDRQRFLSDTATGTVQYYSDWAGEFRVWPLPTTNESLTIRYYKKWSDLVDPSDEPVIPDTFHDILVDYASGQLALRLPPTGDRFLPYSKAQPYLQASSDGLIQMLNSDLTRKTFDEVLNYDYLDFVVNPENY